MAKDNEDVSKETIRQALAVQTKALLGFTDAMRLLIKSVGELRGAISVLADEAEALRNEIKNG